MKKYFKKNQDKITALFFASFVAILLFLLFYAFIYIIEEDLRNNKEYEVTISYSNMIDEIQAIINSNISLLEGFGAYINTIDTYEDESVYRYLEYLIGGNLDTIRNVTIFRDTTIKWVYPLKGNEDAIGVDLAKVPTQSKEINLVKKELTRLFTGPVDLVQGGTGFIVRVPLTKNDQYWGMVSIVLRSEITFNFIRNYSEDNKVDYYITFNDDINSPIYGNPEILNMNPIKFQTKETLGGWDIYTIPQGGWNERKIWHYFAYIIGTFTSVLCGYFVFKWSTQYSITLEGKNSLEKKYIRDQFTGVFTREYFDTRAKEAFYHAKRNNYPLSMLYFDLDHFKRVNDRYGHLIGDKVLLAIVKIVNATIRKEDVFARWGGDEFIILMPETDLSKVKIIAERIRYKVENCEICKSLKVTISMGCSQWVENEYLESWFLRTDKALYKSKNTGKNKVSYYDKKLENDILLKIEWSEKWSSGNYKIDQEHKKLFLMCNNIIEKSLSRSASDNIINNIESFFHELRSHFREEIEILEKVRYHNLEAHKKRHDEILSQGDQIFQHTKKNRITLIELFSFLVHDVIIGHLVKEDAIFFKHLSKYDD